MTNPTLHTEVTRLLGIQTPIIGAPMGWVAGPELAAAVTDAGGLGVMGHSTCDPSQMRDEIVKVRELTDGKFGIGLLFDPGQTKAPDSADQPVPPLPSFLEPLAKVHGLGEPSRRAEDFDIAAALRKVDLFFEEKVPVLICGFSTPAEIVRRAHEAGVIVISLVGTRRAAQTVEQAGADLIVAQGHEAGGHTGRTTTLVLVPQVVDAVSVPVVAAGGIVDARGMAAALALGAGGVLMGTRFLATPEANTAEVHKQAVLDMVEDDTLVSRTYTGKPSRVLRNDYTDAWRGHEHEILPMPHQWRMVEQLVAPAKGRESIEIGNWPVGQGAVIVDKFESAGDVVRSMTMETTKRLGALGAATSAQS